ncbi:MAG: class I SAM-dependent methyltransferase [Acidobacteria bacterium]|nr:class I SAM-dependent methyltransferase [Acidobacteriota bacterium]
MAKTQRELAFLRDLYVQDEWTRRFNELADKHIDLSDSENLLYINAGTGTHALILEQKWGEKTDIFASVEDEDQLNIARDKAAAISSKVDFSTIRFEDDAFDAVLADGSFIRPDGIEDFIADAARVARTGGDIGVFFPGVGSFGEIFSLLWEVLFNEDLGEHGHAAETMITELPTISQVEAMAARTGMVNIQTEVANEIFEYDDGKAFVTSPLVEDFLLPHWLETLEDEDRERVTTKLAELIDAEDHEMSFRFSVKMNLLTGEKG